MPATMTWTQHYQPPQSSHWHGRDDGEPERMHQRIQCHDARDLPNLAIPSTAFGLLGFASDVGVYRNQGRPGAIAGPKAIRQALTNFAIHLPNNVALYDLGDIVCADDDLESAQQSLGELTTILFNKNIQPILIGGGHEIAWGHYQGIAKTHPQTRLGIINFDAHYDLRELLPNKQGSSGSGFLQIARARQAQQQNFNYLCIGIQPAANTPSLMNTAKELGVQTILAQDLLTHSPQSITAKIDDFINHVDQIYLSLCLDVFNISIAPGVSAPQALGLLPTQVQLLFHHIVTSDKVISFDIAELAPNLDHDHSTAKLAASFVIEYLMGINHAHF